MTADSSTGWFRRVVRATPWGLASLAAWYAYAWLTIGWWALPLLAAAHSLDGWRAARRHPRRPGRGRGHYGAVAGQALVAVALVALVGYRPDWLIGAGLAVAAALRLGDEPAAPPAAAAADAR